MSNQEAGGSGSGSAPKRTRTYIQRQREEAKQWLIDDYFGEDDTPPKYLKENFRRRRVFKKVHFDIEKTYALHEEKHELPKMLGSIDCMHWEWRNCPKSLHGQFKRRDHKYPTLILEVVADQKLWNMHAYFRVPEENNDLNVLYGSRYLMMFLSIELRKLHL
ncbi:zinc finger, CCHC-type containing protein [Tanacetum coccineum]